MCIRDRYMERVKGIIEAVAFMRQEKKIKLKWPVSKIYIHPEDEKTRKAIETLAEVIKFMGNAKEIEILEKASGSMKEFFGGRLAIGDVIEDEMIVREVIRKVQVLRKKEGLNVKQKINLWLKSDKETESILKKWEEEILTGTGSSKLNLETIEFEKGSIEINGRTVRIGFKEV